MVADTISVIHAGVIEQSGPPHELYERPCSVRVATSLGEANCFASAVQSGVVSTPLGAIPADSHADAKQVMVVIRPEAIVVSSVAGPNTIRAKSRSLRFVGEFLRVEAETPCGATVIALASVDSGLEQTSELHLGVELDRVAMIDAS